MSKLTASQIRKLKAPASGYSEYSAGSVPGLRIRVMSSGIRSWVFRFKLAGKNNVITLGRVDALPIADAEAAAKSYRAQITLGQDPAQEQRDTKRKAQETQTREDDLNPEFADFAADYMTRYSKKRKRTWQRDEQYLNKHILPVLGSLRLQSIARRDIVRVLNKMRDDNGITTTSNRVRSLLHKMFNWAIQQGLIEHNPVAHTERLKETSRDRVLTDGEIRQLWDSTDGDLLGYALRFILLSGQRPGEVAAMQWEHVQDGVWTMERTKNGKPHKVPISGGLRQVLDDVQALQGCKYTGTGFVFPGRSAGHAHGTSLAHTMARVPWDCAADKKPHPHDLRRTCASTISRLGHPRITITKVLNHTETHVDAVYDRWSYLPEMLKALDSVWTEVRRIVRGADVLAFPAVGAAVRR
ncbi:MAG: tyrosine-type recombinase/integrase [Candidatus Thiothrix moscowensis]|nr:tyrosine-type recombinase/integrase [Candidatus Thiothrix moscowensis]